MGENLNNDFYWKPLTPETWSDFERLFGSRGACGGCWCMLWRLKNKDFELPLPVRIILKVPWLRDILPRIVALGITRVRLESP